MFLVLGIIAIALLYLLVYPLVEKYSNHILLTQDRIRQNLVYTSPQHFDQSLSVFVNSSHGKFQSIITKTPKKYDIVCTPIPELFFGPKPKSLVAVTSDEYKCAFIRHSQSFNLNTLRDVIENDTTILYLNEFDVPMIKCIFVASDINIHLIDFSKNLQKIDDYKVASKQVLSAQTPDNKVFFYNDNDTTKQDFVQHMSSQLLSIISFDDSKMDVLRMLLPFAAISNYDWKKTFSKYKERFSIHRTLTFHNVLTTGVEHNTTYLTEYLMKYFDANEEFLTYYSKITDVPIIKIIESFSDALSVSTTTLVKVFYDSTQKHLQLYEKIIDGIPLKVGDKIELKGQRHSFENGLWLLERITEEGFIAVKQLDKSPVKSITDDKTDPRYICYDDDTIKIKGLCESTIDIMGRPKKAGIWDRPCDTNEECPFFQKNSHYKNYRGGCQSGYCELPMGVERTGYRTYKGVPLCHGCKDPTNPRCCNEQRDPNLAFTFDEYERSNVLKLEHFVAGADLGEEYIVDDKKYVKGDFSSSFSPQLYHNEISNEEFQTLLNNLVGVETKFPDDEEFSLQKVLEYYVGMIGDNDDKIIHFKDMTVTSKDVSFKEKVDVSYSIDATLFREEKSHGKRIRIYLAHEPVSNTFTVEKAIILGIVNQYDIVSTVKGTDIIEKSMSKQPNARLMCLGKKYSAAQSLNEIIKPLSDPHEYICENIAPKLAIDRNILVSQCSSQEKS